jgi:hypothetical protein
MGLPRKENYVLAIYEKYMTIRTCRLCNDKYPVKTYLFKVFTILIWSSWNCENCDQRITFNDARRVFVNYPELQKLSAAKSQE